MSSNFSAASNIGLNPDYVPSLSGGGGGAVDSVFGRTGVVIAVAGDYTASQVTNDSLVTGAFVSDALNTLDTTKASLNSAVTFGSIAGQTFEVFNAGQVQINYGSLIIGKAVGSTFTGLTMYNQNSTSLQIVTTTDPTALNYLLNINTAGATTSSGTILVRNNVNEFIFRNISDYAVSKTLTNGNIIVGNGSNVATAVAMSGDATIINTGALTISNQAVTFSKMQHISTQHLVGRHAAGNGDIQQISLGTNLSMTGSTLNAAGGGGYTYLAITLSVPNTTYNKAALAGANYLAIQTNDTTARTITIDNTGFAVNDYIIFSFLQNSQGVVSLIIGSTATPITLPSNKSNTILAIYNGTNWNLQSMANSTDTIININAMALGLGTSVGALSIGIGNSLSSTGANVVGIGHNQSLGSFNGVVAIGQGIVNTNTDSVIIGLAGSGGNTRAVSIGAYTKTVRNNSVRFRLDNSTSISDTTYPSHSLEFIGLMATTNNNTPTEMFVGNDGVSKITLQANNQLAFTGSCQAYKSTQDASAKWDFSGMIKRDGANNTSIVGTTILTMVQSNGVGSGLVLDITADDTTENLKFTATGNTGETWYWFADVKLNDLKIA